MKHLMSLNLRVMDDDGCAPCEVLDLQVWRLRHASGLMPTGHGEAQPTLAARGGRRQASIPRRPLRCASRSLTSATGEEGMKITRRKLLAGTGALAVPARYALAQAAEFS